MEARLTSKPILFSSSMIRAILDGRKTQTRRIIRPVGRMGHWPMYPTYTNGKPDGSTSNPHFTDLTDENNGTPLYVGCSRICPRDQLWTRETWAHYQTVNHIRKSHGGAFSEVSDGLAGYRADGHDTINDFRDHVRLMSDCDLEAIEINGDRWRPSIHMPRWASRITLLVTDVRVQRLQDISEADAIAEGIDRALEPADYYGRQRVRFCSLTGDNFVWRHSAIAAYRDLWQSINGPGSWDENPFVAAYSFDPIFANIDSIGAGHD